MRIISILVLVSVVGAGGWFIAENFEIRGLDGIRITPKDGSAAGNAMLTSGPRVNRASEYIRVASFNIQVFGTSKIQKLHVMDFLARIVRKFDVVAIQEIRSKDQDIVPRFVEMINAAGRQYDYVIGPRMGRTVSREQYAFVFDRASVEVDRSQLYTVEDPDDLLHRPPLVGWFRVRGPADDEAFTFSLVNIHTDPDEVDLELDVLDDVYRLVRDDGRNEDDVIVLGDFNADDRHLGQLGQVPGIGSAVSGIPTNTRGDKQYDNLVFHQTATREFTGRGGVFDFMREYNITQEEALEVSDHMPVWAEFSIYEGGEIGRVAARPE